MKMLKINRVKVSIKTENKEFKFDDTFESGLNFIVSNNNTRGKSSVIIAIYYCLGLEEIIGGVNEKVLTSVFKTNIESDYGTFAVKKSGILLEISNGTEIITIFRSVKDDVRNSKLVRVYFSKMEEIIKDPKYDEFYVHLPNAARNKKGFHYFLANFLNLSLPDVMRTDGKMCPLYLQLIFSSMFIEQKNGWAGIYSGMPHLGVKNAKKRVTEYVLDLSVYKNEIKQNELKELEQSIKNEWSILYKQLIDLQYENDCIVCGFPSNIKEASTLSIQQCHIVNKDNNGQSIDDWISELEIEENSLKAKKPKIVDNFNLLQKELFDVENDIVKSEDIAKKLRDEIIIEKREISGLKRKIKDIDQDIVNNKDIEKLKNLGSNLNCLSINSICPLCNQKVHDSLINVHNTTKMMNVTEAIKHLKAQREMLEFTLEFHSKRLKDLKSEFLNLNKKINALYSLGKAIRGDLYSIDESLSETIIYKKIEIKQKINKLKQCKLSFQSICDKFSKTIEEWNDMISKKKELPNNGMSDEDKNKLEDFKKQFTSNLKRFKYTSVSDVDKIDISPDNYMPLINNFDMKFDSSASDNIRAIWAYTLALLQTSNLNIGNHPGLIIFDEPTQHNIGANDAEAFFNRIIELKSNCQIIIGITVNNEELSDVIKKIEKENYKLIYIENRAFM